MVHAWNPGAGDGRRSVRGALSVSGVLTLSAVALVVVLVSLPRLRGFALRENESDAASMLALLGESWRARAETAAGPDLAALLRADRDLARRLEDCRPVGAGRLLRHGYLFDAVEPEPGRWALRGWPWHAGQTGRAAFVWSAEAGLCGHPNDGARYGGPDAPPPHDPSGPGWRPLGRERRP
jgi:hypothetical protein